MDQLTRNTDWDKALQEYLDAQRSADLPCGVFVARGVEAETGTDVLRKFKGRMEWARDNLEAAVDEVLEPRPVSFARNGDVVMKDGCLGLCHGAASFFMGLDEGVTGTTTVPTMQCDKAWTVG